MSNQIRSSLVHLNRILTELRMIESRELSTEEFLNNQWFYRPLLDTINTIEELRNEVIIENEINRDIDEGYESSE